MFFSVYLTLHYKLVYFVFQHYYSKIFVFSDDSLFRFLNVYSLLIICDGTLVTEYYNLYHLLSMALIATTNILTSTKIC